MKSRALSSGRRVKPWRERAFRATDMAAVARQADPWLFHFAITQELPVLDLSADIVLAVAGPEWGPRALHFVEHHHLRIGQGYRVLSVLFAVAIGANEAVGQVVSIIVAVLCVPLAVATMCLVNRQLLRILLFHQEYVLITILNILQCLLLVVLLRDNRAFSVVSVGCMVQTIAVSDAIIHADRGLATGAFFAGCCMLVVGVLAVMGQIDVPIENYAIYYVGKTPLRLTELIVNTMSTLALLAIRVAYHRHTEPPIDAKASIICTIYRAKLKLVQGAAAPAAPLTTEPEAPRVTLARDLTATIDARHVVFPLLLLRDRLPRRWQLFLHANGAMGILWTVFGSLAHQLGGPALRNLPLWMPLLATASTLVFVLPMFANMQRQLLRALLIKFDVLFILWHLITGSLCLADMFAWDVRSFTVLMWVLWIVLALLVDALPPITRKHFGIPKRLTGAIVCGMLLTLVSMIYAIAMDNVVDLQDRRIIQVRLSDKHVMEMRTQSYFLNRLLPLGVWLLRLTWDMLTRADSDLVFLNALVTFALPDDRVHRSHRRFLPVRAATHAIVARLVAVAPAPHKPS